MQGADQRKQQSSVSLAFVRVIHRRSVNSPHKRPVTRKMFPFDDVIMYKGKRMLKWQWQINVSLYQVAREIEQYYCRIFCQSCYLFRIKSIFKYIDKYTPSISSTVCNINDCSTQRKNILTCHTWCNSDFSTMFQRPKLSHFIIILTSVGLVVTSKIEALRMIPHCTGRFLFPMVLKDTVRQGLQLGAI